MYKKKSAFTLIELLVVIAIIAILLAIIVPKLGGTSHQKEMLACTSNLKKLGAAFHMYVLENDGYAIFNPNTNYRNDGDYFWAWEALYLLGPYLNDPDHEKFYNGEWNVVRCPGNRCNYYAEGPDRAVDQSNSPYSNFWQNRQAPLNWPDRSIVTQSERDKHPDSLCSKGRQIVDYQYNQALGGAFIIPNLVSEPKRHKLNFIVHYPNEAVIFADIAHSTVLHIDQSINSEGKDVFVYGYLPNQEGSIFWNSNSSSGKLRTNDRIHHGKGINAVFVDGHVEFLEGCEAYNGYFENTTIVDDLYNWGITNPINDPDALIRSQVIGIHGFRRNDLSKSNGKIRVCIVHDDKDGLNNCNL